MAEESKGTKMSAKGKEMQRTTPLRAVVPAEDVDRMLDRMLADFLPRNLLRPISWNLGSEMAPWEPRVPRVDVINRDDDVVIRAELPGVEKKDLDVAIRDSTVVIKANVEREEKEEEGDYYRRELMRGTFSRAVALPAEVDAAKAKASFKDGILELVLPKVERAKAHHVNIE